jgi:phospholipase C
MDLFPLYTGVAGPPPSAPPQQVLTNALTMGYYDGNTVTAMWNYAQNYAMSDNSYDTTFGPSTPGALNLVSGQTNGVAQVMGNPPVIADGHGGFSDYGDADPIAAGVTWGFFEGGFDLTIVNPDNSTGCKRSHTSNVTNVKKADYIPHHQPFQYYTSTANFQHTRPTSVQMIGHQGDAGNHQYDTHDFFDALNAGNFPAVSFLKAPGYQDGHAGYSDPLDEQTFIVDTINFLMQRPDWKSTAVVIAYDDSDGWYDHQLGQIVNSSQSSIDALTGPGQCGAGAPILSGISAPSAQGRCGYGPRQPLLVISPYTRANYVDHTMTDLSSIIRFVEDNWLNGQRVGQGSFDTIANPITSLFSFVLPSTCNRTLILDDNTGEISQKGCIY